MTEEKTERNTKMRLLRKDHTLQEIGDIFGVSRQRVEQIVGYIPGGPGNRRFRRRITEELSKTPLALDGQIAGRIGCCASTTGRHRHALGIHHNAQGAWGERLVAEQLCALGLSPKLQNHVAAFDILADNLRIDVKECWETKAWVGHSKQLRFRVRGGKKRDDCDFYVFVGPTSTTPSFFIVPAADIPRGLEGIMFVWPRLSRRGWPPKWQLYENRWDLILNRATSCAANEIMLD